MTEQEFPQRFDGHNDEVDGFYCERHGRCHFEPLHKDVPDMPPYQEEVAQRRYQHSKHPDDQHDIQQPARLRHRLSVLGAVQLLRIVFHALHQRQLACLVLHIRSQRIYNFGLFGPDGRMIHDLRRVKVCDIDLPIGDLDQVGRKTFKLKYPKHVLMPGKFLVVIEIHVPNIKYLDRQDTCKFTVFDSKEGFYNSDRTSNSLVFFKPDVSVFNG